MKLNLNERNTSVNLALTGLMAALVLVATMFFKVEIPVGTDKTMIGFANVFCILSGLLLGPVYGGLAAGIGSCIFDLMGGWADSAPTTLIFKFMMAFVCGLIAWGRRPDRKKALPRDCGCGERFPVLLRAVFGILVPEADPGGFRAGGCGHRHGDEAGSDADRCHCGGRDRGAVLLCHPQSFGAGAFACWRSAPGIKC